MKKLQAIKLAAAALSVVISSVAFGYGTYEIDKVHSAINFKALHMNAGYTWGRFKDFGGKFTVDEKKPENSKIEIEVMANSIDTLDAKRDDHVRGPDFLNTKEFQKIWCCSL